MKVFDRLGLSLVGCVILSVASCAKDDSNDAARQTAEVPHAVKPSTGGDQKPPAAAPAAKVESQKEVRANAATSAVPPQVVESRLVDEGWVSLFDTETLFGWKPTTATGWSVHDGAIVADAKTKGFLMTTFELADYEFQCDFRLEKGGNSGIFLRTPFNPQDPAVDCYEFNLCDSHPAFPTGSIVARKKSDAGVPAEGDWKRLHLRVEGTTITADIDGKPVIEFVDDSRSRLKSGHIALQANGGKVEFKSILLRPLNTAPIFDGKDLAGWHLVPGAKGRFDVVDGAIHVAGGPAFLESDEQWADFVLQAQFRTNGAGLNSGIFFRSMPGTDKAPSNGYEFQIHNSFIQNDRSQPVDHGTGAIFRRVPARWVVGNDNEWVSGTLIANGAHFSTWVNGIQVVDWTDERAPDENPRKGQRLEAGHLILQGHDETTNLDFRKLAIAAIPETK